MDATPAEQTAFDAQMTTCEEMRHMANGGVDDKDPYTRMMAHCVLRLLNAIEVPTEVEVDIDSF